MSRTVGSSTSEQAGSRRIVRSRSFVCSRTIEMLKECRFSTSTRPFRSNSTPRGARRRASAGGCSRPSPCTARAGRPGGPRSSGEHGERDDHGHLQGGQPHRRALRLFARSDECHVISPDAGSPGIRRRDPYAPCAARSLRAAARAAARTRRPPPRSPAPVRRPPPTGSRSARSPSSTYNPMKITACTTVATKNTTNRAAAR